MTIPDVSVVIPTRNRRAFLAEAVDSVLGQTGPSLELIVVDDASDDGSGEHLSALTNDPRVTVIRNPSRREKSFSRNAGLACASGRTVMFLDDDDVLLPGALERLLKAVDSCSDAVASCGARIDWRPSAGPAARRRDSHVWFRTVRQILPELVFGWSAVSGQNLYRMDAIRRTSGFREDIAFTEDRLFWMEIARQGPVVLIPQSVMLYRLHDSQVRPPDIMRLRNRIFRLGMHMAVGKKRRDLVRSRAMAKQIERGETALRRLQPLTGMSAVMAAVHIAPTVIVLSPLVFPWVFRRLVRSLRQGMRDWRLARMTSSSRSMDVAG